MSSGQRDVVFFGSIAATIIRHEVKDPELLADLEKQNATLKLRLTATAPTMKVEEVFGAVGTSAPYELRTVAPTSASNSNSNSGRGHRSAFLPVLLEVAQDAAADGMPPPSEGDDNNDGEGGDDGADVEGGSTATTINISVDLSRSGTRSALAASKRLIVPLNKHAASDTCTIVRLGVSPASLSSAAASNGGGDDGAAAAEPIVDSSDDNAAITLYVLLRVIDLSEKVSAAEEADDALREELGLSQPVPKLCLAQTNKSKCPYGAITLSELYHHYLLFYSRYYNKVLKSSEEVVAMFTTDSERIQAGEESYPHRWNVLTTLNLERVLLGEEAFSPVLMTAAHCVNLQSLIADRNQLGDITCGRMCAVLSRHRYLREVSLEHNIIYEGGATQLLRLCRRNCRITSMRVAGNWCSDAVRTRIEAVAAANKTAITQDPLNVFSSQYSYLVDASAIPAATQKLALGVWAMLSAAPLGDVDVWVRNSTTRDMEQYVDEAIQPRLQAAEAASAAPNSVIPPAARAPLLNEVMRTVYTGVSAAIPDPLVKSVFTDVVDAQKQRADASKAEAERFAHMSEELVRILDAQRGDDKFRAEGEEADNVYAMSFMKVVVTTMRALANGSAWDEVASVLKGVGRSHREMGVLPEDYWLAVNIFIRSLNVCLGSEEFTSERLAAFLMALALGVKTAAGHDQQL